MLIFYFMTNTEKIMTMEKPLSSAVVGWPPICSMSAKTSAGRKRIVIKLSLEQLLKSGQDTIEIQFEALHPESPSSCYARDMFLFGFYTRGMSFVDMARHSWASIAHALDTPVGVSAR